MSSEYLYVTLERDIHKDLEAFMKSRFDMDVILFVDDDEPDDMEFTFELKAHSEDEIVKALDTHFGSDYIFHTSQLGDILAILVISTHPTM